MTHCLQGTDIRTVLQLVAKVERDEKPPEEAFEEAWRIIVEKNPLPSVCGRVCPHPCEVFCLRNQVDEPVAVNNIERFIGDWGLTHGFKFTKLTSERQPEKVAVVGSGPAGLSCAYHLARRGYDVTIFEAFPGAGGMLRYGIPPYRLPRHILDAEIKRILELGIELRLNTAVGRDLPLEQIQAEYDAVFIGIGAQKAVGLGCPGEQYQGVYGGVEFLRLVNSGQPIQPGGTVIVVGGGNTAIDAARTARRLNPAATVIVLYRRTRAEMPAIAEEIEAAMEEGVEFRFLAAPLEIQGENGKLARVLCQKMQLSDPDESGRRRPVPIPGETFVLSADTLIAAVSQRTDWDGLETLKDISKPTSDAGSSELTTSGKEKRVDRIYAGGDVRELGLVAESILQGRRAAEEMHARFRGLESPAMPEAETISPERMYLEAVRPSPRHQPQQIEISRRLQQPWQEVCSTLSCEKAVREAGRCIGCGESFIKRPKTHPVHVLRRISQIGVGAFLFNSYFAVFSTKTLYGGPLRSVCVPGLNCHSCPTALMGCPIGIAQHFAATHTFPWFLIGFLGVIGVISGRFTCGWLCPWGLVQDLLYRFKKLTVHIPKFMSYLKYSILLVVVIIIPYLTYEHWFSKLCPCGALIAAIPWAVWNPVDPVLGEPYIAPGMIGTMFWLKMWILGVFLVLFLFIKRPFCRTVCPLGAIYALFNRVALVSVQVGEGCVDCGQCRAVCPVDLDVRREANSEACIKCLECTQCQHIRFHWNRFWKLPARLPWKRRKKFVTLPDPVIPVPAE
jgi:NADPH-dependent glutamate synthase beta subunit-like oxidoreductase